MSVLTFALGETVSWQSQSRGHWTAKKGTVVEIVEPGSSPQSPLRVSGFSRSEVSYVVAVARQESKNKPPGWAASQPHLYWPRTVALQKVKK